MQVKTTLGSIWSGLVFMGGAIISLYKKANPLIANAAEFFFDNWHWILIIISMIITIRLLVSLREQEIVEQKIRSQMMETERGCAMSCLPYVSKRIEVLGETKCYCYNNLGTFEPNE